MVGLGVVLRRYQPGEFHYLKSAESRCDARDWVGLGSLTGNAEHALLWTDGGTAVDLHPAGFASSEGQAVRDGARWAWATSESVENRKRCCGSARRRWPRILRRSDLQDRSLRTFQRTGSLGTPRQLGPRRTPLTGPIPQRRLSIYTRCLDRASSIRKRFRSATMVRSTARHLIRRMSITPLVGLRPRRSRVTTTAMESLMLPTTLFGEPPWDRPSTCAMATTREQARQN